MTRYDIVYSFDCRIDGSVHRAGSFHERAFYCASYLLT